MYFYIIINFKIFYNLETFIIAALKFINYSIKSIYINFEFNFQS